MPACCLTRVNLFKSKHYAHTHTHLVWNRCIWPEPEWKPTNPLLACVRCVCMWRILLSFVVKTNHSEIRTIISLFTLLYSVSFEHKERELERYLFAVSFCWIVLSSFPSEKCQMSVIKKFTTRYLFVRLLARSFHCRRTHSLPIVCTRDSARITTIHRSRHKNIAEHENWRGRGKES